MNFPGRITGNAGTVPGTVPGSSIYPFLYLFRKELTILVRYVPGVPGDLSLVCACLYRENLSNFFICVCPPWGGVFDRERGNTPPGKLLIYCWIVRETVELFVPGGVPGVPGNRGCVPGDRRATGTVTFRWGGEW
jgi:hypothetical protein